MAKYTLKDGMPRKKAELALTVSKDGNLLEIGADGYGEFGKHPDAAFPISLELYNGKLTLRVFGDINSEDATHTIDLEGARESARKPRSPSVADRTRDALAKKAAKAEPTAQAHPADPSDAELASFDAADAA